MVASTCPRRTRSPVSDTSSFWIQPAKRVVICARPRSFGGDDADGAQLAAERARAVTVAGLHPDELDPLRGVRSTGDSPGTRRRRLAAAELARACRLAVGFGTRVMPQIGHSPGWSCTIDGCIGQV